MVELDLGEKRREAKKEMVCKETFWGPRPDFSKPEARSGAEGWRCSLRTLVAVGCV